MLRTSNRKMFIIAIFVLLRFVSSNQKDIIFSNTAITVESAAKRMKRKNSEPISLPAGMLLNIFESVVKRNEESTVPASAVTPLLYVKQAGKTIRPDVTAIIVSSEIIVAASPKRPLSFPI